MSKAYHRQKRADWRVLKKSNISDDAVRSICMNPLIVIDDDLNEQLVTYNKKNPANIAEMFKDNYSNIRAVYGDVISILEVVSVEGLPPNSTDSVFQFHLFDDRILIVMVNQYIENKLGGLSSGEVKFNVSSASELERAQMHVDATPLKGRGAVNKEHLKIVGKSFMHIHRMFFSLFNMIEHSDLHPVIRKGVTPSKGLKGHRPHIQHDLVPWERGDLSTIVFLNALPTGDAVLQQHKGGSHASPVYHQRRGHFRTMRAERYKDHKDFGKPKWIKAMWVGEDQAEVSGVTYKVLRAKPSSD